MKRRRRSYRARRAAAVTTMAGLRSCVSFHAQVIQALLAEEIPPGFLITLLQPSAAPPSRTGFFSQGALGAGAERNHFVGLTK